jgi:hypothetical protein
MFPKVRYLCRPVCQPCAPTFRVVWDDFELGDDHEDEPWDDEQRVADAVPSPGERLLHALGQLHRLHLCGRLPVHPSEFDIEDVARIVGVWPQLELVLADDDGTRYHFAGEVLHQRQAADDVAPVEHAGVRRRAGLEALVEPGGLGLMSTTATECWSSSSPRSNRTSSARRSSA